MPPISTPRHCREDPPWSWCGDPRDPAFGSLFAWPAAAGATSLTFDRAGRHHALTLFAAAPPLTSEIVLFGRRFDVVCGAPPEAKL